MNESKIKKHGQATLANTNNIITTKLVSDNENTAASRINANRDRMSRNYRQFITSTSDGIKQDITDISNILELIPELELIKLILVSSIISPKDLMTCKVIWKSDSELPSKLKSKLLSKISDTLEKIYKINSIVEPGVTDALFDVGSKIKLILPESSIDDVIHKATNYQLSNESISEFISDNNEKYSDYHFLGKPTYKSTDNPDISTESDNEDSNLDNKIHDNIYVFDDISLLKKNILLNIYNTNIQTSAILADIGLENHTIDIVFSQENSNTIIQSKPFTEADNLKISNPKDGLAPDKDAVIKQVTDMFKVPAINRSGFDTVPDVTTSSRKPKQRPVVLDAPAEGMIPVFVPGDPTKHIGYYVLIDKNGLIYSANKDSNYYNELKAANSSNNAVTTLINDLSTAQNGSPCVNKTDTLEVQVRAYRDLITKDLIDRLSQGIYKGNVEIGNFDDICYLMLANALKGSQVNLLYVPASLVSYLAYIYRDNGVGRSLISKAKITAGMAAAQLLAQSNALIKNCIGKREVSIVLDKADDNPEETIEVTLHDIARANAKMLDYSSTNPIDITAAMYNASIDVTYSGSDALPTESVTVAQKDVTTKQLDSDIVKTTLDRLKMSLGVPPDLVEAGTSTNFAVQTVTQNVLLMRRVAVYSERTSTWLTDFVQKVTIADGLLLEELIEVIKENIEDVPREFFSMKEDNSGAKLKVMSFIRSFLTSITCSLPLPDMQKIKDQSDSLNNYINALDLRVDNLFNDEFVQMILPAPEGSDGSQQKEQIQLLKGVIKSAMVREYCIENNILPEFDEFINNIITAASSEADKNTNVPDALGDVFDLSTGFLKVMRKLMKQKDDITLLTETDQPTPTGGDNGDFNDSNGSNDFNGDSFSDSEPVSDFDTSNDTNSGRDQPETSENNSEDEEKNPMDSAEDKTLDDILNS